jgi:hypothetical protein
MASQCITSKVKKPIFRMSIDAQEFYLIGMRKIMKNLHIKRKFIFLIALLGASLGASKASFAACDQTLNPGANVASAVSNAAAGSTICLNSGNYGNVDLSRIAKASDVTIQSASGKSASASFIVKESSHLKFQNMTISEMNMESSANKNISVLNNTFKGQLKVHGSGSSSSLANILIDGNSFDGIDVCTNCSEGRLSLYNGGGVTVSNNHFGGAGESDGIQWGGYGGTVGPGNVFEGIIQGNYSRHVDAIQLYGEVDHHTITGNYFINDTVYIGAYDKAANLTITNNVFGPGGGQIQLMAIQGGIFKHNTVKNGFGIWQGAKSGDPSTKNVTYSDNIFVGVGISDTADQKGCSSGCTYDHNLFSSSSNARGNNNIIGMPTFVGNSDPNNMAGYALTSNSLGYRAASDGKDMGYISSGGSGTTSTATIAPPSNLRVQ